MDMVGDGLALSVNSGFVGVHCISELTNTHMFQI